MNADPQDRAEALDSEMLGDEYPPERPVGVDQYGITPAEERVDEPLAEHVAREEPDTSSFEPEDLSLVAEPIPDVEPTLIAKQAIPNPRTVDPDEGDPSERLGDATVPAEEEALHETE